MSYIDTSVIVAALDPSDRRRDQARRVLEGREDKFISELVLAELSSVLARREELKELASELGIREHLVLPAILIYLIKRFDLTYMKVNGLVGLPAIGELYSPMAFAVIWSTKLKLRTLDLFHLAYVKIMKDEGSPVRSILTADKEFQKAKEIMKKEIGVEVSLIE
ncbi:MAG: PIN domain nuclease [Thermoproteota archaeon]|nr:MAG: PIN domain nuclease [Candidatus Korarchaeota archaeon]